MDPNDPKKPTDKPTTDLATHTPPTALVHTPHSSTRLEPEGFDQAWKIASYMAEIKYCGVKSAPEALSRIMFGANLGLSAMSSLANVFTIPDKDGAPKPALEASTMLGVCLMNPNVCEYFYCKETTDARAVFVAKRRNAPQPQEMTWTIEMAARAGLIDRGANDEAKKKSNWNRYPDAMLRARAITALARLVFPDLIRGFSSVEEMRDQARESIETTGELVSPAIEEARASRDFPKEAAEIKAKIIAAKTKEDFDACRKEIQDWIGGEPYFTDFKTLYADAVKAAKAAKPVEEKKPEGAA